MALELSWPPTGDLRFRAESQGSRSGSAKTLVLYLMIDLEVFGGANIEDSAIDARWEWCSLNYSV